MFFTFRCQKHVSLVLRVSMTTFLKNDETQRIHRLRGSVFYISMPKMCFACLSCKRLNDYFSQKQGDTKNSNAGDLSSTLQKSALSQRVVFLRLNAWNMFRASQYISSVSMTTFPRNDETQRTHSMEIPPPLSKKVSRIRGFIPSHLSQALSHCLAFCLIGSNFYISVSTFNIGANGIFSQSPRETEFRHPMRSGDLLAYLSWIVLQVV